MLRHPGTILCCLACSASILSAADDSSVWAPAAEVGGVPYQSVEELRSFYKLSTGVKTTRKGAVALSMGDLAVELGPGSREMRIGGVRLMLARPLQRDAAGNVLLSREDWVKWLDPILRPTYISGRAPVRTVVLDAAHGGHDVGTPSSYVNEAATTLQLATRLKEVLEKQGFQVVLTRSGDYFLSDRQRVEIANREPQAIFVSLHLNSGRTDYRGAQVYTTAPAAPGTTPTPGNAHDAAQAALAFALQSALVTIAGAPDAGCARAHYSLLSSITCPAVWVELGYATHPQEGPALASAAYQDTLVQALAQGIGTYAKVADPATRVPVQQAAPRVTTPTKPTQSEQQKQRTSTNRSGSSTTTRSTSTSRNTQRGSSSTQRSGSTPQRGSSSTQRGGSNKNTRPTTPASRTRR